MIFKLNHVFSPGRAASTLSLSSVRGCLLFSLFVSSDSRKRVPENPEEKRRKNALTSENGRVKQLFRRFSSTKQETATGFSLASNYSRLFGLAVFVSV